MQRVAAERRAGLSLALAIRRALEDEPRAELSLFSELRRQHPELEPRTLTKRAMVALSAAIEDEVLARAARPLLCAAFQRERFYRQAERRWRELARTAQASFVFADFARLRRPRAAAVEVPLAVSSPMRREWLLVCWDRRLAVCLAGWERPERRPLADGARRFEAAWTLDPGVVRQAAQLCAQRLAAADPGLGATVAEGIDAVPAPPAAEQLLAAAAITARVTESLG